MSHDYSDYFTKIEKALRAQTRAVPASYGSIHGIAGATESAIRAVGSGRNEDVERLEQEMRRFWEELLNAPLPAHMALRFQSGAIQEYVKFLGVRAAYHYVVGLADTLSIERVSSTILSASESPRYHESFKGRLGDIAGLIARRQDQLIDMLNTRSAVAEGLAGGVT